MKILCQQGHQIAVHVAAARKSMQQQHGRIIRIARLAEENINVSNLAGIISYGHIVYLLVEFGDVRYLFAPWTSGILAAMPNADDRHDHLVVRDVQ